MRRGWFAESSSFQPGHSRVNMQSPHVNAIMRGPKLKAAIAIPVSLNLVLLILFVGGVVLALLRKRNGYCNASRPVQPENSDGAFLKTIRSIPQAILAQSSSNSPLSKLPTSPPPARTNQSTLRCVADLQASVHFDFLMTRSMSDGPNPYLDSTGMNASASARENLIAGRQGA